MSLTIGAQAGANISLSNAASVLDLGDAAAAQLERFVDSLRSAAAVAQRAGRVAGAVASEVTKASIGVALLTTKATLDPDNWLPVSLPERSRTLLYLIAHALPPEASPDDLLQYAGTRVERIVGWTGAGILSADLSAAGTSLKLSTETIGGSTALRLIQMLHEAGIIRFRKSPDVVAAELLAEKH